MFINTRKISMLFIAEKENFILFSLRMESFASGKVFFLFLNGAKSCKFVHHWSLSIEKYFSFRHFQIIFLLVVRRIKQRKHATTNTVIIIIWPWNIRNTSFSHIWILLLIFPLFFFSFLCWMLIRWATNENNNKTALRIFKKDP